MNEVNKNKLGLVVGGFLALWHLVWVILVGIGWAQPLIDFVFRLHSIQPLFEIVPLTVNHAVGLIVITAVFGYVLGWVIGWLWNRVHRTV